SPQRERAPSRMENGATCITCLFRCASARDHSTAQGRRGGSDLTNATIHCRIRRRRRLSVVVVFILAYRAPVHANTTASCERGASEAHAGVRIGLSRPWRSEGHEDMVVPLVGGEGMRVERSWYLGDEGVLAGIDDTEARSAGIVASGEVVVLVARVEPDLIRAPHVENRLQDSAGLRVENDRPRRVRATDQNPQAGTERQTSRRAIADREKGRHRGPATV